MEEEEQQTPESSLRHAVSLVCIKPILTLYAMISVQL